MNMECVEYRELDDIFDNSYEEYIHVSDLEKYEDAKEWVEELRHHFYNTGNLKLLENALSELGAVFDVKMPNKEPKLQKKRDPLFDFGVQLSKKL